MAIKTTTKYTEDIGSWQEVFQPEMTDRINYLRNLIIERPEICLEHAYIEKEVREEIKGKDVPRALERVMIFKRYLEKRTIFIEKGELLVGNVTSKHRASVWFGELYNVWAEREIGDPKLDPAYRQPDPHRITDEERRQLKEEIIPYFKGKTFEEYLYSKAEGEVAEKGFSFTASCPHIPNTGDLLVRQDAGHMLANYEKVLRKGLKGIREEIELAYKECKESYSPFNRKARMDWYEAALMGVDAVIEHSKRFAKLALDEAEKENDEKRKAELIEIARICNKVPENPAESWHEALQSMWFIQMSILCEQVNYANSMGRFDQYMFPYYNKSVNEDKSITRDEALELLECFWIKLSSFTEMYDYGTAMTQTGFPITQNLIIGGQLRDGTDGCNDLTMLCLNAEENVGLIQPEIAMRIWEGTPDEYLRKACEIVRLGRGKPKFYGDSMAVKMVHKAYPLIPKEDLMDYAVIGCVEVALPYISQNNSFTGIQSVAKLMELTLNNGKCAICGQQIGPMTGDPRTFESIERLKQAFREQTMYWMTAMAKAMKVEMECQGERLMLPFSSTLIEGPIQRGIDMMQGGAWNTHYGVLAGGMANAADSFSAIDTLVFKRKVLTMDELINASLGNFEGKRGEEIRQMCLNECPKYGNDDDYADMWGQFVLDTWYDALDAINSKKELIPKYGGAYTGSILIGNGAVAMGPGSAGLPCGRKYPDPVSDTMAPCQGMDISGADAVIKSVTKMPAERFEMGTALNQRLTPQMLATDEDITKFMQYLRTAEKLGLYHVQFNVVDAKALKRAMEHPEDYKDLLVRVASYCAYFVELDKVSQMDIINRTEQGEW